MPTFLADSLCRCGHRRGVHIGGPDAWCLGTRTTMDRAGIKTSVPCPCTSFRSAEAAGRETVEARAAELRTEGRR